MRDVGGALAALHADRPGGVVEQDEAGMPVPQFPVRFTGERIPCVSAIARDADHNPIKEDVA